MRLVPVNEKTCEIEFNETRSNGGKSVHKCSAVFKILPEAEWNELVTSQSNSRSDVLNRVLLSLSPLEDEHGNPVELESVSAEYEDGVLIEKPMVVRNQVNNNPAIAKTLFERAVALHRGLNDAEYRKEKLKNS